ncbi:MAG TPA: response regulator [Thermoanaerobaculia bacterium]|nr:response regulator [Thermoanaerobaculia bacterium]
MSEQRPKPSRILVADDDISIRQLVTTIVKREGYEVDSVSDGLEAVEKLKGHDYAVILLDLMMPRMDGFGVIDYLKQHAGPQKPVVLVITAYADQKFKEVDPSIVSGVLRKPFEVADLGGVISLCVEGYDEAMHRELKHASDPAIRELSH